MIFKPSTLLFLIHCVYLCSSYKILVVFPHPGLSHFMVFKNLLEELARRGHELTVLGHIPPTEEIPNYRFVDFQISSWFVKEAMPLDLFEGYKYEKYREPLMINFVSSMATEPSLMSENFKEFLREENHFDLVMMEFFNSNPFGGLAKKYNAPLIGLSAGPAMPWTSDWFGQPDHPAYVPLMFLETSDEKTFIERLECTVILVLHKLYYKYFMEKPGNELAKQFLNVDLLEPDNIFYNTSLMLVSTHFSLHRPKPLVPNVIEVGGIHISGKVNSLPDNIEKWINESSEGVIYFSLGSMIKGHTFPEDKKQAFLKAFGRLSSYRVLWKWENETMASKPDNVMTQKWMPQFDILCHPNVKAFISHGGLLGITEAVHCGVPTIVMPQFGDQHTNARALEANGGGIILQLHDVTEERVFKALKKVLSADFRKKAKELSERFRDRPLPPLETAIYWIEYVARHRGAPHMRTAAVGMPFWKYYLIDVISFLLVISLIFVYSSYIVIKFLIGKVLHKDRTVNKEKSS